jgi:MFS family permease
MNTQPSDSAHQSSLSESGIESRYAWRRLMVSLAISTISGIGLWSVVVVMPLIQAEFGVDRADASLPYTATMLGFAVGAIFMGRLSDRKGIVRPLTIGAVSLGLGYIAVSSAQNLWQFTLAQGLLIGMAGCSVTFGPLVADVSHWFTRNRGIAVGICASGNYLAGAIWPPLIQYLSQDWGWRGALLSTGLFCATAMLLLSLALRRPSPVGHADTVAHAATKPARHVNMSPAALQALLAFAAVCCCVAMSMPQVHIVAYCSDLGYGVARGAEMLSLMLAFGVISRLASGWIADHIGGVRTLLLGSALQTLTLVFYLPFDGLTSLYIVSALFGLSQGGIVPAYAIIVREYFPAQEAGARIGLIITTSIIGMALGGWMSGAIFDWTGSYHIAFLNGIAWNLVNVAIALWLLWQPKRARLAPAPA